MIPVSSRANEKIFMRNHFQMILYGSPTPSDLEFLVDEGFSLSSGGTSTTLSSTRSDAQSAPPELERLFERICNEYAEWVVIADKQLPPEWDMPDLVRAVIGEEALATPSYMMPTMMSCYMDKIVGCASWFLTLLI